MGVAGVVDEARDGGELQSLSMEGNVGGGMFVLRLKQFGGLGVVTKHNLSHTNTGSHSHVDCLLYGIVVVVRSILFWLFYSPVSGPFQ